MSSCKIILLLSHAPKTDLFFLLCRCRRCGSLVLYGKQIHIHDVCAESRHKPSLSTWCHCHLEEVKVDEFSLWLCRLWFGWNHIMTIKLIFWVFLLLLLFSFFSSARFYDCTVIKLKNLNVTAHIKNRMNGKEIISLSHTRISSDTGTGPRHVTFNIFTWWRLSLFSSPSLSQTSSASSDCPQHNWELLCRVMDQQP